MARLGDIASVVTKGTTPTSLGFAFENEGINFIKIESIEEDGSFIKEKFGHISEECDRALSRSRLQENDILFSIAGAIGRTAIVTSEILPANTNQALAIIRIPKGKIDYKFLDYALHSGAIVDQFEKKKQGVAQLNISLADVRSFQIPDISIQEQSRIVAILGKVDRLISLRKKQLQKLNDLVKSRFVEMFGDPVLNQYGFPVYRMDEVVDFQGGSQPDKSFFEYEPTPDNIRLIQIRDYKTNDFITYIPKSMAKRFCNADDIMIGRYGPPIFQILQGIEGSYNVALMKATPRMGNREFIRFFLKQDCLLRYLEGLSKRTAGQDGIQMDKLKAYPFPMPPLDKQELFAGFVVQVNKYKLTVQQGLDKLELLKQSLMQKFFG